MRCTLAAIAVVTLATLAGAYGAAPESETLRLELAGANVSVAGNAALDRLGPTKLAHDQRQTWLELGEAGKLRITPRAPLPVARGFTLELRVRCDRQAAGAQLATAPGVFLLRVDPEHEGGHITLFVAIDGKMEPRVTSTVRPEPDRWYRVAIGWTGTAAVLEVDHETWHVARPAGAMADLTMFYVGSPAPGGSLAVSQAEFRAGWLDRAERLAQAWRLRGAATKRADASRFDFTQSADAWQFEPDRTAANAGPQGVTLPGDGPALVARGLDLDADALDFVALATGRAGCVQLVFVNDTGRAGQLMLPASGPNEPAGRLADLRRVPAWRGRITALGLQASQEPVDVAWLAFTPRDQAPPRPLVRAFLPKIGLERAGRPETLFALVRNVGGPAAGDSLRLCAPAGCRIVSPNPVALDRWESGEERAIEWSVEAERAGRVSFELEAAFGSDAVCRKSLDVTFAPPLPKGLSAPPEPQPVATKLIVGAWNWPGWEGKHAATYWANVARDPGRVPVLGCYNEELPAVKEWETRYAVEHGIGLQFYCWGPPGPWRVGAGRQNLRFDGCLHEGLFASRYAAKTSFALLWTNEVQTITSAEQWRDFTQFVIGNYFKHPSYLRIDRRPVFALINPGYLAQGLGGVAAAAQALERLRRDCVAAGLESPWLLGCVNYGPRRRDVDEMKALGLDATCSYINGDQPGSPRGPQAIAGQLRFVRTLRGWNVLPHVVTASVGWSGWGDERSVWRLSPDEWQTLLQEVRTLAETAPGNSIDRRLVMLDNWNEYGEGHWIMPTRDAGFAYLDAVRAVFGQAPAEHLDLVPRDFAPLDMATAALAPAWSALVDRQRQAAAGGVADADSRGAVLWLSCDRAPGAGVLVDRTGHGLGAMLDPRGRMLVPRHPLLLPDRAFTLAVRLMPAAFSDRQVVAALGDQTAGYRLELRRGVPWFYLPRAGEGYVCRGSSALRRDAWTWLVAVYDGGRMSLWQDAVEVASALRRGPVTPPEERLWFDLSGGLSLSNGEPPAEARFDGHMGDVRLWHRALSTQEIGALR